MPPLSSCLLNFFPGLILILGFALCQLVKPLMSSSKAAADDEPMWLQLSGALVQVARVTASLDLVV